MTEVNLSFEGGEKRSGVAVVGSYLFDAARRLGIEVEDECGRRGECESCAMKIVSGGELLSPPTTAELKLLGESRIKKGERLSCQAKLEKAGEIVVMMTQKKEENKPVTEAEKIDEFRKEFEELPLEKKIASLVELEAIALSDTVSFVLNSPYKIASKVMDVLAEFGLKLEEDEKKAKRPDEHKEPEKAASAKSSSKKTTEKKKTAAPGKTSSKKAQPKISKDDGDSDVV